MTRRKPVRLSELEGLEVLWPGDVHMFAEFLLRSFDARDLLVQKKTGQRQTSRPTIHGIASHISTLMDMPISRVAEKLTSCGLDLRATVKFDSECKRRKVDGVQIAAE